MKGAAKRIQEMPGQHYSRTPYTALHTDRPSSAENGILSAEKKYTRAALGAFLYHAGRDMGDNPVMIALPPRAARMRP